MFTHQELLKAFPFPEIREVQIEALEKVARTFGEGKRFCALEIPCGGGKSPLSWAISSVASQMDSGVGVQPGSHITTTQIILQQQYMRDFQPMGLKEIKGKSNYMCAHYEGGGVVDCTTASALHGEAEQCGNSCTYVKARKEYVDNPIGVTNLSYLTAIQKLQSNTEKISIPPRTLLVVDEAHNTEGELVGLGEVDVTEFRMKTLGLDAPLLLKDSWSEFEKAEQSKNWLTKVVIPVAKEKRLHFMSKAHQADDKQVMVRAVKMAEGIDHFLRRVGTFLDSPDDEPWVAYNQLDPKGKPEGLILKPLYANRIAEEYLFSMGEYVLMMSATILAPRTFAKNLGIEISDFGYKRFQSDFPAVNRPVIFDPAGSMNYKSIDSTLPLLAKKVESICKKHPFEKGIIHTNSFKVGKAVVEHLQRCGLGDRVLTHNSDKGSRDTAVAKHLSSPEPTILISPSLTEGLDLVGDLGRWQILCKTPYPPLGDLWIKARMQADSEWYQWMTGLAIMQASGRSVRNKEDHATTYLLDSEFRTFYKRNESLFPQWWKDGLKMS